ncbi:C40 family peptidase [Acidimangrovimonas sediminis]|uniref:C40 family peptidase n=1 Tax=Acidimangrovimonas sediminis TaxID=2056283 RepID=UPI000C7FD707|nr:NlpC/P60 family protein [Acidimangrovimonas sediminis]
MTKHWVNRFIAIPHVDLGRDAAGCDCWGLLRHVYAAEFGISLPDYLGEYVSDEESEEVDALVTREEPGGPWRRVEAPRPFDALLFRRGRWRSHVGIVVDARHMLHMGDRQSVAEDWTSAVWRRRLAGIYRHHQSPYNRSVA